MQVHLGPQNSLVFGNRFFANVLKVRIEIRSYWIKVKVSCKRKNKTHRDTNREEGHVKTEAKLRVTLPQPRNARGHQELGEARKILPWSLQRECGFTATWSHKVYGNLL